MKLVSINWFIYFGACKHRWGKQLRTLLLKLMNTFCSKQWSSIVTIIIPHVWPMLIVLFWEDTFRSKVETKFFFFFVAFHLRKRKRAFQAGGINRNGFTPRFSGIFQSRFERIQSKRRVLIWMEATVVANVEKQLQRDGRRAEGRGKSRHPARERERESGLVFAGSIIHH